MNERWAYLRFDDLRRKGARALGDLPGSRGDSLLDTGKPDLAGNLAAGTRCPTFDE